MTEYTPAPEVAEIAGDLIATVEDHARLIEADIIYVWRDKATKSKGRVSLGKARRLSGLNAFLARDQGGMEPLFLIEIAADQWEGMTTAQRYALVDHELSHLRVRTDEHGELELSIRGHDVEEFKSVVDRHGLWKSDVADFAVSASDQLTLAIDNLREDEAS